MQVFITSPDPFDTAIILDSKRFNKQIIEVGQILDAITGRTKAWKNHPCVLQYKDHLGWLQYYLLCFKYYKSGNIELAKFFGNAAFERIPEFHTIDFFNQMKRRLYTKDSNHYNMWSHLGFSDENWYYVGGKILVYKNGKRV